MGIVLEKTQTDGGVVVDSYKNNRYDDYYINLRADDRCNKCLGRGKLHYDHPGKGLKWVELCSCVHK